MTRADAADQIDLRAARQLRAARACLARHARSRGGTVVKDPGRAARVALDAHRLHGATSFPGRTPPHPRERRMSRLVGQSTKDTIVRVQFQGECRTNARAQSELEQLADDASGWTTSCTKPLLLWSTGQIAAHRRLLAVHVRATTSPERGWRMPSRDVICAGGVRSSTFLCRGPSQVRPLQHQVQLANWPQNRRIFLAES